jgi:16S rRNA processing protein RimM
MSSDDLLLVGVIARPHGIRGSVIVNPETDFADERFRPGEVLLVGPAERAEPKTIVEVRFHQRRPIVSFEGVDTVDEAELLAGLELRMPVAALAPLPEQTYYRHDLVGCEVRDTRDAVVGQVTAVEGTLERSYLVMPRPGGEVMIPMVEGILVSVDIAERRIVVNPPEGLLEVNARSDRFPRADQEV